MIKKILSICGALFCALLALVSINPNNCCNAASRDTISNADFESYLQEVFVISGEKNLADRLAGSEGEEQTANRIVQILLRDANNFKVLSGAPLAFSANYVDGGTSVSHNVVALKDNADTDKKVVLVVPMDNYYGMAVGEQKIEAEGLNQSLTAIVSLLAIAKNLNNTNLPFDFEIAFLGAENYGSFGSENYLKGKNAEELKNIISVIYLHDLSGDANLKFFAGEKTTKSAKKLFELFNDGSVEILKTNTELGLETSTKISYSSLGMDTSFCNFAEKKLGVISIFANNKYIDFEEINADTIAGAKERYGEEYLKNATAVTNSTINMLTSENFASLASGVYKFSSFRLNLRLIMAISLLAIMIALYVICKHYSYVLAKKEKENFEKLGKDAIFDSFYDRYDVCEDLGNSYDLFKDIKDEDDRMYIINKVLEEEMNQAREQMESGKNMKNVETWADLEKIKKEYFDKIQKEVKDKAEGAEEISAIPEEQKKTDVIESAPDASFVKSKSAEGKAKKPEKINEGQRDHLQKK